MNTVCLNGFILMMSLQPTLSITTNCLQQLHRYCRYLLVKNIRQFGLIVGLSLFSMTAFSAEQSTPATQQPKTTDAAPASPAEAKADIQQPPVNPVLRRQQQLAERLKRKDPIWLKTPTQQRLALYHQDQTGKRLGTVILVADVGLQVGQPGLVSTLAKALPASGWSTLSITLPLPINHEQQSTSPTTASIELLAAAIDTAQKTQPGDIYILFHGDHLNRFNQLSDSTTKGLILINLPATNKSELPTYLDSGNIAILDIVASRDRLMQNQAWQRRKNLAKSKQLPYRQLVFAGINKNFPSMENNLARIISAWLTHNQQAQQKLAAAEKPN